ncbi:MAG: IPT/TIG domain-containing protein [Candidatus Synoicihabitans palmerolidicus]|nr:IPT/TIG domain-containing protein [Candidatus Synoicihabitans palmerolidicus]
MFNKEALTKLQGVEVALFASAKTQSDGLADDTTLELLSVASAEVQAGADATVTLTGKNFNAQTVAVAGGHELKPSTSTSTSLEVLIPAGQLAAGHELPVWVSVENGGSRS